MTKQEIFNEFYQHFVVEGHKRNLNPSKEWCVYRSPGCAIGCLKAFQEIYEDSMDADGNNTISVLIANNPKVRELFQGVSMVFLELLQELHDGEDNWTKRGTLRKSLLPEFALYHGVEIPK